MKAFQMAAALGGFVALVACGSGNQANKAGNITANDAYVAPGDVEGNQLVGNEALLDDAPLDPIPANAVINTAGNGL